MSEYSQNYIWDRKEILGSGGFGLVVKGYDQKTKRPVAVKIYHNTYMPHVKELQQKEFDILKDLNHENVVKLLAFENQIAGPIKVLVMEFCNGENLLTILRKPPNFYGFEKEDLFLVLKHLTAAMKYLFDQRVVHRDIKPSNLIKHMLDDGSSVIKLADFGFARSVIGDFESVYGTKEYLYYGMYEKKFLKRNMGQTFSATVDLWSLGVTLFHLATGLLPFRHIEGGIISHEKMYELMTTKAENDICGECSKNEEMKFSDELPSSCLLYGDPKAKFTNLLSGLLKSKEELQWSFNRFFDFVTTILSYVEIHVYFANRSKQLCLYMKPDETFKDLKERICKETESSPSKLLLLWDNTFELLQIGDYDDIAKIPTTSPTEPLIAVNIADKDWSHSLLSDENHVLNEFSDLVNFFRSSGELPVNAYVAAVRKVCILSYGVKRFIVKIVRCYDLLLKIPKMFQLWINQRFNELDSNVKMLNKQVYDDKEYKYEVFKSNISFFERLMNHPSNSDKFKQQLLQLTSLSTDIQTQFEKVDAVFTGFNLDFIKLKGNIMPQETNNVQSLVTSSTFGKNIITADTYVRRLLTCSYQVETSFNMQYSDPSSALSVKIARFQMIETINDLFKLQQNCLNMFESALKTTVEWYSHLKDTICAFKNLEIQSTSVCEILENFSTNLAEAQSKVFLIAENLTDNNVCLPQTITSHIGRSGRPRTRKSLREMYSSLEQQFHSPGIDTETIGNESKLIIDQIYSMFNDVNINERCINNETGI